MVVNPRCVVMESDALPNSLLSLKINMGNKVSLYIQLLALLFLKFKRMRRLRVDMGELILKALDVPTKLPTNNGQSVVNSRLDVDGVNWNVPCVSMGNPHCVTFSTEGSQNLQVDELNLADIGPKFEHHVVFPARINTV